MNTSNNLKASRTAALLFALSLSLPALSVAAIPSQPIVNALSDAGIHIVQPRVVDVDGIVILKGKVRDHETALRATAIVRSLGHARVANLLQVAPLPTDAQVQRDVERALLSSRALEGCKFNVRTENGVVTLEGRVREELQRDVASDLVRDVDGVRQVVNHLQERSWREVAALETR